MSQTKKIVDLPQTTDEYWEGAETSSHPAVKVKICEIHNKRDWINGDYFDNKDGTISCGECPWGCRVPGYMRVQGGKIIDLRFLH